MSLYVSAQEPPELRALGTYNRLCEDMGADFVFFSAQGQIVAIQRKEIHDLVSSLGERFNRELLKMSTADIAILLIEGEFRWTATGDSLSLGSRQQHFTRDSYDGLMRAVQHQGVWVVTTSHLAHTVSWLTNAGPWFDRAEHSSLTSRGNGPRDMFGSRDATFQRLWWWQAWEGIGAKVAKELDAYWEGRIPAVWDATYEEWMKMAEPPSKGGCPGIGKQRAQALWDALMNNDRAKYDLPGSKR